MNAPVCTPLSRGPVEDLLAIRELVETFTVGIMRKDTVLWGDAWVDDGTWNVPLKDEPVVGKGNMILLLQEVLSRNNFVSITSFPTETVIEGDRAHGKAYCQELIFPKAGAQRILVGCFSDEYVKRDGRWYFLSRTYESLWRSTIPAE
jgi:hypothetical protein